MIQIDGAMGEGGGQIVRSALTLSLLTGKPFEISRIRAGRRKPGLMPQHLSAVAAAAAIGGARVAGAQPGSTRLAFAPAGLRGGSYRFDIGTAGSTSLLLQTLLLPLAYAGSPATVVLGGGTHVAWSPCYHYLELHWLPYLRQIGISASLSLRKAGFYPRGGGELWAAVEPARGLLPLVLRERGRLLRASCLSAVANLDLSIAVRQQARALARLRPLISEVASRAIRLKGVGRGTMLLLLAEFERGGCCYFALGERGKPAEQVADAAADAFIAFIQGEAAIDSFLADQLLLPLVLANGTSVLHTAQVTPHLLTNIAVIREFLPAAIGVERLPDGSGVVRIEGASARLPSRAGTSSFPGVLFGE